MWRVSIVVPKVELGTSHPERICKWVRQHFPQLRNLLWYCFSLRHVWQLCFLFFRSHSWAHVHAGSLGSRGLCKQSVLRITFPQERTFWSKKSLLVIDMHVHVHVCMCAHKVKYIENVAFAYWQLAVCYIYNISGKPYGHMLRPFCAQRFQQLFCAYVTLGSTGGNMNNVTKNVPPIPIP